MLDESTNYLDPVHRKQVWDKLLELNRTQGLIIILVTHNVIEAEKVLQKVGLINHGEVRAIDTVGELKKRISRKVKLEMKLNSTAEGLDFILLQSQKFQIVPQGENQWTIYIEENDLEDAVHFVIENIGLKKLNDFRILTPTLEDVYIQLSGRVKNDESN